MGDPRLEPTTSAVWTSREKALAALDAVVADRVGFLVVGWNARWWLDEFAAPADRPGRPVVSTRDVDIDALS